LGYIPVLAVGVFGGISCRIEVYFYLYSQAMIVCV
jgi:hypothetical protein